MTATAFPLENLAKRSCNYLDRMVDGTGLPYFNVFYARSAQAYSDFDNRMQPVFYGEPGPCRLYQRQGYLANTTPQAEPLWVASDPFKW